MNKITTAQKTLEYYVVLSGESTPPVPTPTQVTIDGNFEIEQSGSTYTMSFGIQNFDWSSLESGWTGTVVYGQNTLTFDSSNLNNNTITISVGESQIDLTATTATMEITSGTDEYEGTSNVEVVFVDYMYIENTYNGTNTMTLTTTTAGTPTTDYSTTVQYSKDRTNWTTVTFNTSTPYNISMNQGEKVYFRNNNGKFNCCNTIETVYYATTITGSQTHKTGGDIRSLLDYTNIQSSGPGCFYRLFYNDTNLVSSSELTLPPTVGFASLAQLFFGCTSLATVSAMPATTTLSERCYAQMFYGCSSLVTAPALPATTLANNCYDNMFRDCSSLVEAPNLPANTMQKQCYNAMFRNCTSLTTVQSTLQATTLAHGCYSYMFDYCTSLVNPPSLPVTNLGQTYVYFGMFRGCTSMTTAPVLPATTLTSNCYYQMFYGCSSLNEITVCANSISASSSHTQWVSGVAATGTFRNLGSASWPSGDNGIPSGWTVVTQ